MTQQGERKEGPRFEWGVCAKGTTLLELHIKILVDGIIQDMQQQISNLCEIIIVELTKEK